MNAIKTIYFLSALLMFAVAPLRLHASHDAGMELTYTHLSGTTYKFRCVIYRDCMGVPAPTAIWMDASSLSCGLNLSHVLILDTSQSKLLTLICGYDSTNCTGGTEPGIQKYVYEKEITLGGQCPDWNFEAVDASRSSSITTLVNAAGESIYVPAHLNNLTTDNNSPQFTNDPIVFICSGQDFHFNNGMYDADGDSISYYLIAPRSSANIPVTFNLPYTYNQPLTSAPSITFNDFTGDLFIHSLASEVTVFTFQIMDWRNGELMGAVVRDVIMFTYPCSNNPTATGMNGTAQQFLYVFPDDTVCFDVLSDDIDVNDTVTMTWNQTIPNATFVTNGIPHPTGTFCWTPTIGDVRSQPYMFTVMVHDNACPIVNACIYSYFIYVTLDSSLVFLNASELSTNSDLSIYPNPSDGVFMLKQAENISSVKIFDYSGKIIQTSKPQEKRVFLDAPPGVYCIEIIYNDGKTEKQKLLIKK